jgi:hypothetical protein
MKKMFSALFEEKLMLNGLFVITQSSREALVNHFWRMRFYRQTHIESQEIIYAMLGIVVIASSMAYIYTITH